MPTILPDEMMPDDGGFIKDPKPLAIGEPLCHRAKIQQPMVLSQAIDVAAEAISYMIVKQESIVPIEKRDNNFIQMIDNLNQARNLLYQLQTMIKDIWIKLGIDV